MSAIYVVQLSVQADEQTRDIQGSEHSFPTRRSSDLDADKAEKEKIDKLNQADSLIFQTEKQLTDLGDKLPADKKAAIESALGKLKDAHKSQDIPAIDAASGELNSVLQSAAQDIYGAQQGAQQGPSNPGPDNNDGGVTDVDFEEVK